MFNFSRFTFQLSFRIVLAAFILLASISSVVVPPFETPDEIWHVAFIQQVASGGGLPVSEPNTKKLWRQQGGQGPAYYLAAAALTFWVDQSDFPALYKRTHPHAAIGGGLDPIQRGYFLHYPQDGWPWRGTFLALHIARFFSVFLGAVTLWATYQTLCLLVPERMALLGVTLFAFIPQFIFISGAASNDNAINAMAALLLWRLVLLLKSISTSPSPLGDRHVKSGGHLSTSPSPLGDRHFQRAGHLSTLPSQKPVRAYILIGLLLGLALLSKVSALWLLLLTVGTLAFVAYPVRSWRLFAQSGLIVGGLAFLVSGWWFIRNLLLYGDPLASNIWLSNILLRDKPPTWRRFVYHEWESLDHSFWGLFGWFNVAYPTWVYRLFQLLEVAILLGLLLWIVRRVRHHRAQARDPSRSEGGMLTLPWSAHLTRWPWPGIILLVSWLLMISISWVGFFRIAPAAQGRYFLLAAPTLALGMAVGLRSWQLKADQPPILAWGVAFGLFVLSVITPWWIIHPAYQPTTPLTSLPEGATPLNMTFGEVMRLEGYTVTPRQIAPSTPMDLTLYWRALQPMDEFYSVAVKGFGRAHNGELIARDDSYPDAGRWPTTIWQPGQLIADRWRIWISGQTITPTLARLRVDVYRLDRENGGIAGRLPATVDSQSVALPVHFGDLIVREPNATPAPPAEFVFRPLVEGLTLEKSGCRGEPQAEECVVLDFAWQVGQPLEGDYQAFFHLTSDPSQPPLTQDDFRPIMGVFPTPHWWPGDKLADQAQLPLPSEAPEGEYELLLGLYDLNNGQRVIGEGQQSSWPVGRLRWNTKRWLIVE
ncbi:MAG: hypothetical protein ACPGWR_28160 [Ardenticatenaceae bacterium]